VLQVGENCSLAPEYLKRRLVKTFDGNHRAGTFMTAEINIDKIARHDLLLKLEMLRIDFSLLELRESFCDDRLI
jgi:hypothetical protein